ADPAGMHSAAHSKNQTIRLSSYIVDTTLVFAKDVEFSSPSAAAAVVHGGSANGLIAWRSEDGIALKNLDKQQ
ncbi:MAG: DUF4357 domain-containing protein, partial [Terracidiphilus sp.]